MTAREQASPVARVGAAAPGPGTSPDSTATGWRAMMRVQWRGAFTRGWVLAALALLVALLLLMHNRIPNIGGVGSLVETFLPWFGFLVPILLLAALWRRSAVALIALLIPAVVWLNLFGGLLIDKSRPGADLIVISHNVGAGNSDPAGTARELAAADADLLALQELSEQASSVYERELAKVYPHHVVLGTVGLWSKLPLSDIEPIDIQLDYGPLAQTKPVDVRAAEARALRATVTTQWGPLAVYVAHLASVRVFPRNGFGTAGRDRGADTLATAVAAEPTEQVILLGDLNGTTADRAFDDLTSHLDSVHDKAGQGFGFSWPASFPTVRIDHILIRGASPRSAWTLSDTGSDHLPVAAGINW